jgi:enoyl-CoA hydratase/carnithine racemase
MEQPILVERREQIALVTLNRPESLNSVNRALRDALIAALHELEADPAVRGVVIRGAGERAFCSGQDLSETIHYGIDDIDDWLTRQHAMYQAVRDLDKACVVAWNGVAAGAGFQIGLCADLRVAAPDVKIGQPEIKAGLASIVGSYLMTLHLPLSQNVQLSLTGELITGQRGYELGLVNALAPRDQVVDKALALAQELTKLGPTATRLTKQRFRALTQPGFDAALAAAKRSQREAYESGEPQAAMKRFFEARGGKAKA